MFTKEMPRLVRSISIWPSRLRRGRISIPVLPVPRLAVKSGTVFPCPVGTASTTLEPDLTRRTASSWE